MPRNNNINVSTMIQIGTVERETVGSASGDWGVLDFNSSLMVWEQAADRVNGASCNGTSACRLNK